MQLTGGEAVVRTLEAQGIDTVFGMPGVHNLAIYDALRDSSIRHIVARHEQGAAFMADGYARATGRVGVCLCTSGPALLNAATPLGTAYCDSSPVLCIASQIPSYAIGKEKGYIHECRDQLGCVRPVTAWSGVVVLTGDGGFMFNCQELAVSAQFQLPVIVVLFNNRGFGVMKPQQQVRYGRTLAVDLVNPDFDLLAQAFGFAARRVSEIPELGPAVAAAVESETTCLIEVTADLPLQVMEPAMRRIHLALTAN